MDGTILLVGTRKGLWIGRSDEERRDVGVHRSALRHGGGLLLHGRHPGRAAPAAGRRLVELAGPAGPALRRPRRDLDQERRRRDPVPRRHRRHASSGSGSSRPGVERRRGVRRHRAGRGVPLRRRRRDVRARAGAVGPPAPAGVGRRLRRPGLPHDPAAPDRRRVGDRARSRPAGSTRPSTAAPRGRRATRASGRSSCPRASSTPSSGSACTRSPATRPTPSGCSCRTTAASTAPTTRAAAGRRSPTGCRPTSASRSSCTRTSRTRSSSSRSTARERRYPPEGQGAGLALPRRRRAAGSRWARGCPTTFFVGVMRDAMCADDHERSGLYVGARNGCGLRPRPTGARPGPRPSATCPT